MLAVPNVSQGRDAKKIDAIAAAFSNKAELLDLHSDSDHERTVVSICAQDKDILEALLEGAARAVELIDMRTQIGQHPTIGALDVAPIIYLSKDDRERAKKTAKEFASSLADSLELPIFLYGELATSEERRERAHFRNGGIAALRIRMKSGELSPDYGPDLPHETAGATLVSARPPLVAFNLQLNNCNLAVAAEAASKLRESPRGLPGLRAMAIYLKQRNCTQLTFNVQRPDCVTLADVVEESSKYVEIVDAEIVGLVPEEALRGFPEEVPIVNFDPDRQIVERRISR